MTRANPGYDRLARAYRAMEFLAFGRDLEKARFMFLERIAAGRDILLLGEGDGRCAVRLAGLAPQARIVCVDSSPAMIDRASRRIAGSAAAERIQFVCADARSYAPPAGGFDAVATLFFLDCFGAGEVAGIVARAGAALRPGAQWLFADFVVPESGIARLRARAWLGLLYGFFRWETGISVRMLPPSEEIIARAGWLRVASRDLQFGLLRSSVYARPAPIGVLSASA
ncbi:MAG: class I SAM-dependent methyltransferase [Opitutaceae bacterium]|jgi:ubiquinone/menaquinone biosynthesis C-methylase UbiE